MSDAAVQFGLALFGLTALCMALSNNVFARKWAPVVGFFLAEPLWLYYSINARAWGIVTMGFAYSAAYAWGFYNQWKGKR